MRNMLAMASAVALTVLGLVDSAQAQMVPVEWDASGQFARELPIPAGKFIEACEKLPKGAQVTWSFEAASAVDFNIHFHVGKQVRFPAKRSQVSEHAGTLAAKVAQDYCWMWTNKGVQDVVLRIRLIKR